MYNFRSYKNCFCSLDKVSDNLTKVCSGDSGGPLVIEEENEWRLIGMTSWGSSRCQVDGFPQAWANAQDPSFNNWIRETADLQ